ncbi:MAG: MBOAT family protein [Phycisphaerales bacterium]|nr:MBOAT family protein [Phycisphaerales bacterium]
MDGWINDLSDDAMSLLRGLLAPSLTAPWGDWSGFWRQQFLRDRFLVAYAIPMSLVLLMFRRVDLKRAIVVTGMIFIAYVFGAIYAAMWLATCSFYYWLGERYAATVERGGATERWAAVACATIIVVWYVSGFVLGRATGSRALNAWIFEQGPWLLPLGVRGYSVEPHWNYFGDPPSMLRAAFRDLHLCGTAYLTVRLLHYFVDIRRGAIARADRSLLNFLSYTCYAPNFMQGPIERYQRFQAEIETSHERRTIANLPPALWRFGLGLGQGLAAFLYFEPLLRDVYGLDHRGPGTMRFYDEPAAMSSAALYFGAFVQIYTLYLYFAGYSNISAGMARMLGYRQIENFAMPWFAESLRDFWRRWHISLSSLLRDYLYIPLGGNRRHVLLNMCVTFALCGIWHAPLPHLLAWGALMGAMVWVNHVWHEWTKRTTADRNSGPHARIYRAWRRIPLAPRLFNWLLTQHAFVFSLLIFFGGFDGLRVAAELLRRAASAFW